MIKIPKKNVIKLFNDHKIKVKWNSDEEDHYYAIMDIIPILTQSKNPKSYWSILKGRIKKETIDEVTICDKMKLPDKKSIIRLNDVANTKQLLRIMQSIPSPNAELFKQLLAQSRI